MRADAQLAEEVLQVEDWEVKLPKRAIAKLTAMRRLVTDARNRAERARLSTDPAGSLHLLDAWEHAIGLGDRDIMLLPHVGADVNRGFRVRSRGDGKIEVLTHGGSMIVYPASSNVIYISATH